MPLTAKGEKIKSAMEEEYGSEKGESVFYASANKGTITGVHDAQVIDYNGWVLDQDQNDRSWRVYKGREYLGSFDSLGAAKRAVDAESRRRGDETTARLGQICDSIGHLCSRFDKFFGDRIEGTGGYRTKDGTYIPYKSFEQSGREERERRQKANQSLYEAGRRTLEGRE